MGISRITISLISLGLFVLVVFSTTSTSLRTVDQASSSPVLSVRAEALVDVSEGYSTIIIRVKHDYGRPVTLLYVELEGIGKISADNFKVSSCGELIKLGDHCVYVYTTLNPLKVGALHNGVVVFSEGTYPISFTPVYVYTSTKKLKPEYDAYIYGISLQDATSGNAYSLVSNASTLATEGSTPLNTSGLVLVNNGSYRYFGGLGFAYDNSTNIEKLLLNGTWFVSIVRLVNTTGKLPIKWGIGLFQDHVLTYQPEELVAFVGISVNASGAYFVIERYDRDQGLVGVVASTPINISLQRLFNEFFIVSTYINLTRSNNRNLYSINATLYDISLTPLSSTHGSFVVTLPGTPGLTWSIRPALVVMNTAVLFSEALLSETFTLPLITITGVPRDYVLEIYINDTLAFRAVSRGDLIVLPVTQLPAMSSLIVKYPSSVGELLAYKCVIPSSIKSYTRIEVQGSLVDISTAYNHEVAHILLKLPTGDGSNNVTGFIATKIVNRNTVHLKLRLTIQPDLSLTGNLTLLIDLLDSLNTSVLLNKLSISGGQVVSNITGWSRPIEPNETLYLYVTGYSSGSAQPTRVVIKVEAIIADLENSEVLTFAERTLVLVFEPHNP